MLTLLVHLEWQSCATGDKVLNSAAMIYTHKMPLFWWATYRTYGIKA